MNRTEIINKTEKLYATISFWVKSPKHTAHEKPLLYMENKIIINTIIFFMLI